MAFIWEENQQKRKGVSDMTFEQAKKLKEIGFPQRNMLKNIISDEDGDYFFKNPTAEELLEWIGGKLENKIEALFANKSYLLAYYLNSEINFKIKCDTLAEAVFALAIWAHDNKLLEGK